MTREKQHQRECLSVLAQDYPTLCSLQNAVDEGEIDIDSANMISGWKEWHFLFKENQNGTTI